MPINTVNLAEHYHQLYQNAIQQIKQDTYQTDSLIESATDRRFGLTLLIRPDEAIKHQIQLFLKELKAVAPNQYYYVNSDIHITVMAIISCYDGFELANIKVTDYIELITKSLMMQRKFKLHFKGITASSSCILLQGFFEDDCLNEIRDQLRVDFKHTTLQQSMDKRYTLQTAHATVVRFTEKLSNKAAFIAVLEKYRNVDFGTFEVTALELVYNDWYQREKFVQKLHCFELKK